MKYNLFNFKFLCLVFLNGSYFFSNVTSAQTTIIAGQTVDASSIPANTSITINSGGSLNMDAARTFNNVTTAGAGTSTISGIGALTITNTLSVAVDNILSITPAVSTLNLVTADLNNQTSSLMGTGSVTTDVIMINGTNNTSATLSIGSALIVQTRDITAGNGNAITNYTLSLASSGSLKISGAIESGLSGVDNLTCGSGSTVEYNGAAAQIIFDGSYANLTLSGAGVKSPGGSISMTGNLLLEPGSILTLGGNDLTAPTVL